MKYNVKNIRQIFTKNQKKFVMRTLKNNHDPKLITFIPQNPEFIFLPPLGNADTLKIINSF